MRWFSNDYVSAIVFAAATVIACVLGAPLPAHALDCGENLVEIGDAQTRVRSVCGEPTSMTTRDETRTEWRLTGVAPHQVRTQVTITIQVDVWVYDWGPERFMEELRFEGGVLVAERPMGPGVGRSGGDAPGTVHHHSDAPSQRRAHHD